MKLNSTGSLLWQRAWPGANQSGGASTSATAIALDSAGDAYITGSIRFNNTGTQAVLLLKFDPNGNLLWQERIQGNGYSLGQAITVSPSGSIYVTGSTISLPGGTQALLVLRFSPNGTLTWKTAWTEYNSEFGTAIAVNAANDIYIAGYTNSQTGILVRLNSTGNVLWQEQLIPPSNANPSTITPIYALTLDSAGNGYATGSAAISYTNGSYTSGIPVFKFNPNGTMAWTRLVHTSANPSRGYGLAVDPGGNVSVTGQLTNFNRTAYSILLMQLYSNGELAWETARGSGSDVGEGVALDKDNNLILVGSVYEAPPYPVTVLDDHLTTNDLILQHILGFTTTPNATVIPMNISTLTPAGGQTYSGLYDAYILKTQPPPSVPPSPPTVLVAQGTPTNISLSWNQPQSSGSPSLTGYRVYRGLSTGTEKPLVNLTDTRRYIDSDVRSGNTYYYYITAMNSLGESGASNEASATFGISVAPVLLAVALASVGAIAILLLFLRRGRYLRFSHQ